MTDMRISEIQPGWIVVARDGELLGSVVAVTHDVVRVKKSGLLGGEVEVPSDAVAEVETGHVEVGRTKQELESRTR